jgi:hypothetical protein
LWAEGHEEEAVRGQFPCPGDEAAWYALRFPRIAASAGVDFRWEVSLVEPAGEGIVGLEAILTDGYPAGALCVNGRATESDAVFEPFYCALESAGPPVAEWLETRRDEIVLWWDRDGAVYLLLVLAAAMALLLVAVLLLPPREELAQRYPLLVTLLSQKRRVWLPLLLTLVLCAVTSVALLVAAQFHLWTRAAARLQPVKVASAGSVESPWIAYDFLADLNAAETVVDTPQEWYVAPGWMALDTDHRPVLGAHSPSRLYYTVDVPPGAWLHAAAVLNPEVWRPDRGDGVLFIVRAIVDGVEETVYYQEIDPKSSPEDRRWHDFDADLGSYAGSTITLLFITYPLETNDWDWAAWGMPVLLAPSRPE